MKKSSHWFITICTAWLVMLSVSANAQKGMGDTEGMAQRTDKPAITSLSVSLLEVKTGPCQQATGKSPAGTHLMVQDDGKTLNIHLGPESAVDHIVAQLEPGKSLAIDVFRTEKMPEDAYIAQSLTFDGKTIHLRDANLRPSWAEGRGQGQGKGNGQGKGRNMTGPCWYW